MKRIGSPRLKPDLDAFFTKFGLYSIGGYREGYPEEFPREEFDREVKLRWGRRPDRLYFRHLSGWKRSGTYRIAFVVEGGGQGSLIFKNSIYNNESIAALDGLPISPGPPEFAIHARRLEQMTAYVPETYWCREVQTNVHYQYLLKDISPDYLYDSDDKVLISVCRQLPTIQECFSLSIDRGLESKLLKFDLDFSAKLFVYAVDSLKKLHDLRKGENVLKFLGAADQIYETYSAFMNLVYAESNVCPIHGDLNSSNVFRHRSSARRFKLIDWEWAGIGLCYSDLASLLKTATPELENLCLVTFNEALRACDRTGSRHAYDWCKFQRGLFDAGFFAKQILNKPVSTKINIERQIDRALSRTMVAYKSLLHS